MAIYADITADQGSNFSSEVTVVEIDDSPIDLTNYTARGQIRRAILLLLLPHLSLLLIVLLLAWYISV